jgi:beta-N-acetylhexosaminidase
MTIDTFSDEQLAGQRLMVGFEGQTFNDDLRELIGNLYVGGLILFAPNIANPDQLQRLCRDCQSFAARCSQPPLIIAVDQEGGPVARLKAPHFTEFAGNPTMRDEDDARAFARITASELSTAGINMDMAPVMDVAPDDRSGIMADRVFGNHPDHVARMGTALIETLQAGGVMAVAKHFPGIGRTILDSHLDLPIFQEDLAAMAPIDLPPFRAAIDHRVAGIMLSHILYEKIDPQWPASLSPVIARDLLRRQMGYQGVTMTDDLDMGAIVHHFDIRTVTRQVVAAEIDFALICHKGPRIQEGWDEMLAQTRRAPEPARESVQRILNLKQSYLSAFQLA